MTSSSDQSASPSYCDCVRRDLRQRLCPRRFSAGTPSPSSIFRQPPFLASCSYLARFSRALAALSSPVVGLEVSVTTITRDSHVFFQPRAGLRRSYLQDKQSNSLSSRTTPALPPAGRAHTGESQSPSHPTDLSIYQHTQTLLHAPFFVSFVRTPSLFGHVLASSSENLVC